LKLFENDFFFVLKEIPHLYVYSQSLIYSYQWNITLTCVETAGIPRPLLIWRRQNSINPIEQSAKIRIHNGILSIIMATKDDEGIQKIIKFSYGIFLLNRFL
jgi:hypothetical protein